MARAVRLKRQLRYLIQRVKPLIPRAARFRIRRAVLPPLRLAYRGGGVECPICERSFRAFTRFGALCPGCGAAPRHRLVVLYLRDETDLFKARLRVLHFGPEPSLIRRLRDESALDYVPADLDPAPGVARVDMTAIENLGTFDAVIASHVLEHIQDDRAALRELHRVLRPGGWALLVVPMSKRTDEDDRVVSARARFDRFGQVDHVRTYGPDFAERLREAGFEVSAERYADTLTPATAERYGVRASPTVIHFCRRR